MAEKSYRFSLEVLLMIFTDVDVRTLVFSCRHVCQFWKDAVESPRLWKIKISREHGDKFETDSALSTAYEDYPWYVCYALCNNVFNRNLFEFNDEIAGSPPFWRSAQTTGFIWPALFDDYSHEFPIPPPELLDEAGNECLLCGVGECSINQCVDLYAHGFTRRILEYQPPILISEWFAARYGYVAVCHIEVKLFNSEWQCDEEHGYFRTRHLIRWRDWHKIYHEFINYAPDVRYVVFHHGVHTSLPQFYGSLKYLESSCAMSKIAGTVLSVNRPDQCGSSDFMSTISDVSNISSSSSSSGGGGRGSRVQSFN